MTSLILIEYSYDAVNQLLIKEIWMKTLLTNGI
jgi:hypothetical protein